MFLDDQKRLYQSFIIKNTVKSVSLGTSFFRYLTFDIYYRINQHVAYHMVVQYVHHSWQTKEQLLGISISFYLKEIDKLFMLQHHFLCDWQISHGFPCLNCTHINLYLQRSVWSLLVKKEDRDQVVHRTEREVKYMLVWFSANCMTANPGKF